GRSSPRTAPVRRLVPVAAAAAMLVGVLSVIFGPDRGGEPALRRPAAGKLEKPSLLVIHGEGEGDGALQMIPTDQVLWAQVVAIDENRLVTVSAGRNDSVEAGQQLTLYRRIQGGYREIGSLRVLESREATAWGRVQAVADPPRVGDLVVSGQPLTPEEKRALLDCVFSLRLRQGGGANPYDRLVRNAGLEHDVEFLARLRDPRAYDRLARILGGIAPFARDGFPPPGADLAPRMHEWWAVAKDRVRWNPEADRYEE
ncbi:MAG TPA: hypothetical protein VEN81_17010, partial [Planctomycetota bacterium]|nr:hypothetical protein [Planctomycetota bacterium]